VKWEESSACTPLKRDFLRAWFTEDQRFFLAGGSALGLFHLHHRLSFDLDLFYPSGNRRPMNHKTRFAALPRGSAPSATQSAAHGIFIAFA